jgi:MFS family permease
VLSTVVPGGPVVRRFLFGHLLSAVGRGLTLPFLLIYLTSVRGLSAAQAGLVVGWYGAMVLLLAPSAGALIDRVGARRIVIVFLFFESFGTASLAFVTSFPAALVSMSVIAIGSSAIWAGQATLLSSLTAERDRQAVFGLEFTLLNLGIGLGGLVAGLIVDPARPYTFQIVYLLDGLTFLAPALILLSIPAAGSRPRDAGTGRRSSSDSPGYRSVLRHRPFRRLIFFALVLTTCGYAQLEVGFTAFSVGIAEVTPRVVAWALAANAATIVLVQLSVIRWLRGRSRTRSLAVVGGAFGLAWLILGAGGLAGSGHAAVAAACVVGCAVVFAAGETLLAPMLPALTNTLATDRTRGRYNALLSMSTGISGVIGPVTAGPIIGSGRGGLWVALVVAGCGVASLLALSLRRLLTPEEDGRTPAVVPSGRGDDEAVAAGR